MAFGRKKQQSSSEISREELTRTQVLNLQELERVAKFEKQTSKRPAVLFALAGVVAITMGIFYPNIMMAVDNIDSKPKTAYRVDLNKKYNETVLPVPTDKVVCNISQYGQVDGTDKHSSVELYFQGQKLQTYVKTQIVYPIAGNAAGATTVQNMLSTYSAYDNLEIEGYKVKTTTENTATKVAITIDLKKLDRTQLTYALVANPFTNVEYELNSDQNQIQATLTAAGYTCTVVDNHPQQ